MMKRRSMRWLAILLPMMAPGVASGQTADIEHGRVLVETNCARCHGVASDDASQHPLAPPFRVLSRKYPVDALEEAFAEGIVTGHEDMPEFQATPTQIADIIAYISSIQEDER